jgi:hypothetical protein
LYELRIAKQANLPYHNPLRHQPIKNDAGQEEPITGGGLNISSATFYDKYESFFCKIFQLSLLVTLEN